MNIRNVLRVYGSLRNFSDDETALLETLRSLTDSDREQLVESLAPVKAAVRKRVRKAQPTRSSRAESLATVIGNRSLDGGVSKMRCAHAIEGGDYPATCGEYASNPIHDDKAGYGGYHAFETPGAKANVAAGD